MFPIVYAVWIYFWGGGRLAKFSITLWAYVAFSPSVASLEQCYNMVMLKGFFQHFLILKFLLILCVPEARSASHLCKHAHSHSPYFYYV